MIQLMIMAVVLIITLMGCGQPKSITARLNSTSGTVVDPTTGETLKVVPTKVTAIISQRQFLPSFQKCLGLQDSELSSRSINSLTESKTSFSLDGNAKSISAPMMMSAVKVAGELCQDVINTEVNNSQRKYFAGFNLGGNANNQIYDLSGSIQKFASNCWGRSATSDEISIITNNMNTVNLSNSKDINAALFLCTAVLASSQSLRH